MILCVTPNPAVDRTLTVRGFAAGGVFRPEASTVGAGGKGLNAARAIRNLGGEATCAGFLGGASGQQIAHLVEAEGLPARWTWLDGRDTRTCIILIDPASGLTSVINEPGPTLTAASWLTLRETLQDAAETASMIAFSGSLPPGSPLNDFAALVRDLIAAHKPVWIDTSGAPLAAAAGIQGVSLKINHDEAAALTSLPIHQPADAVQVGRRLTAQTQAPVVITLGAQGAVLINGEQAWQAVPPQREIQNNVGAGDSFLGGLLLACERQTPWGKALAQATAAGTASALSAGGGRFTREVYNAVLEQTQVVQLA